MVHPGGVVGEGEWEIVFQQREREADATVVAAAALEHSSLIAWDCVV
jgi:hypothetical protein